MNTPSSASLVLQTCLQRPKTLAIMWTNLRYGFHVHSFVDWFFKYCKLWIERYAVIALLKFVQILKILCLLGWREPHGLFFADSCVNYRHSGTTHLHLILKCYKFFIKMLKLLLDQNVLNIDALSNSRRKHDWRFEPRAFYVGSRRVKLVWSCKEVLEWVWPSMHLMK